MRYYYNKITGKICRINKIQTNENLIEVSDSVGKEYISKLISGHAAIITLKDNVIAINYELRDDYRLNSLRDKRNVLLSAFDKYKTNVNYGITTEDAETKEKITSWYHQLLDLNEEAFKEENIPPQIKYYL